VIALIGNRPALQVGRHQVHDYDTGWLLDALHRAARAAEREDFPFLDEIARGVEEYLESRCALRLLPLTSLFERMRVMLEKIGCGMIADKLEPLAPPVTLSLAEAARESGGGFEMGFFAHLRREIEDLRQAGAEEVRFIGLKDAVLHLCQRADWDSSCEQLSRELHDFLRRHHHEQRDIARPLRLELENQRIE
jgi:hypothetical protein